VQLNREWIAAHLPHGGAMCLLDEVLEWSATEIACRSDSHRAPGNPLRAHGRLGAAAAIEYAAQAMALHGSLTQGVAARPRPGLLASTRGVRMHVERLDESVGSLVVRARYVHGDAAMVLYEFTVSDAERELVTGRAAIAFAPPGGG
jgi:predicted hotdog family 3-hydroxylacyl-ACP dehydratase